MQPSIDELLALDVMTLRDHTERAGAVFSVDQHRESLYQAVETSAVCAVRREGVLVAYAMLRPETGDCWFVGAFGTHPEHRTYAVMHELFGKIAALAVERNIRTLRSHVYKTNQLSIAFHRKLGFEVTRENDRAFEFFVKLDDMRAKPVVRRVIARLSSTAR